MNSFSVTIKNVGSSVNVTGESRLGGLIGWGQGKLTNSFSTGNVTGQGGSIGGLVGYALNMNISNTYAAGNVRGATNVGGLIGNSDSGNTITNTYAVGKVTGIANVGGLVGFQNGGTINNSFWNTETSGQTEGVGTRLC